MNSLGQFDAQGVFQNLAGTSTAGAGFSVPLEVPSMQRTIQAGETWHFQMWYRDGGGQSNFTDGVSVDFLLLP